MNADGDIYKDVDGRRPEKKGTAEKKNSNNAVNSRGVDGWMRTSPAGTL